MTSTSSPTPGVLVVQISDVLWYVDQALDEMVSILQQLGDDAANQRPELTGANSPYVILTHSLGVMEYWGGLTIAGRAINRDRDAEFRASGPVGPLVQRTAEARRKLEADLALIEPMAAPRHPPEPEDVDVPLGKTQGAILLHILEELLQHLGQLQLTRDILLAGGASPKR